MKPFRLLIPGCLQALIVGVAVLMPVSLAAAQSPAVGEAAPEFARGARWVMNEPDRSPTIADLHGEVVVIAHWGTRCGPSVRMLPQMQSLHRQYAERGLHIFAFERQRSSEEQIRKTIEARGGADYAVSRGGCASYSGTGYIPIAWVIGVNGRIAFVGHPARPEFTGAVTDQLSRVRYVGLGRQTVHPAVETAARRFANGDWDRSLAAAREVLADDDAEAEAKADAEYLVEKITTRYAEMQSRIAAHEASLRYVLSQAVLETIVRRFGRESHEGRAARDRLKVYRNNPEIRAEIKAEKAFDGLVQELAKMTAANVPMDRKRKEVDKFRERHAGTGAASRARELLPPADDEFEDGDIEETEEDPGR